MNSILPLCHHIMLACHHHAVMLYCHLMRACGRLPELFIELIWPTRCAGCERLGVLLCASCQQGLPYIDPSLACSRCGAPFGKLVCTECTPIHEPITMAFTEARCALEFNELTQRIIVTYKDKGEQRLGFLLAQMLAHVIPLEWKLWADVLTWIPADEEAVRRRGFDHMEFIAVSLAEQTGLRLASLLEKQSNKDQRSLNRRERQQNMHSMFSLKDTNQPAPNTNQPAQPVKAQRILLIDDVFTTGATLDAATQVLLAAKAQEVRVATICRVW